MSERNLSIIIPAAGAGIRLGTSVAKPFVELGGRPVLWHTLQKFLKCPEVGEIIVATSSGNMSRVDGIFSSLPDSPVRLLKAEGGTERQHSIYNALQMVADDAALVAVHDAVRPFVKVQHIEACCKAASEYGGAVLGVPAKDTIKDAGRNGLIESTPDRSRLWQAQTPQVFRKELLLSAYRKAMADGFVGTDDSSLVERAGGQVKMVEGGRENLKITYPIDLEVAALILKSEE